MPEYTNTFYKACFTSENGQITYGQYFTFYTDLSKSFVDHKLDEIFNSDSNSYTGVIANNTLDDNFFQEEIYEDGELTDTYHLSPINEEGQMEGNENCKTLWLVRTTYYLDGTVETDTELLGTYCTGCAATGTRLSSFGSDCDPGVGGGGSEPAESLGNCMNKYIPLGDNSSCGVTMKHCWEPYEVWNPHPFSPNTYGLRNPCCGA